MLDVQQHKGWKSVSCISWEYFIETVFTDTILWTLWKITGMANSRSSGYTILHIKLIPFQQGLCQETNHKAESKRTPGDIVICSKHSFIFCPVPDMLKIALFMMHLYHMSLYKHQNNKHLTKNYDHNYDDYGFLS